MKRKSRVLLALPLAALVVGGLFAWPPTSDAADESLPDPVAALADRGLEIMDTFEAPSGLTGYAATFQGRPMAIYLTEDGKHAVLGTLIDGQGQDLSASPLERIVSGPQNKDAWNKLESSSWVRDGSDDADVIVYEFTDPNCPYCHKFWQTARPWVEAGKVQIRHVMVGILKEDSMGKAATILASDDPAETFARAERNYGGDGLQVADDIPREARKQVAENNTLMESLGYYATPTILYRTDGDEVAVKQGLPQGDEIEQILGPKP